MPITELRTSLFLSAKPVDATALYIHPACEIFFDWVSPMLEQQLLSVTLSPVRGVRVNRDAVINLLRRIAEKEIEDSPFLSECGITIVQNDNLRIRHPCAGRTTIDENERARSETGPSGYFQVSYAPSPGMRIDKAAVASLVARMVTHEISKSNFLTSCGIRLAVQDMELPT